MNVAVLINLHARRGSEKTARLVRRYLPQARLALTRSRAEARDWLGQNLRSHPPDLLLAAGGDGTITGVVNDVLSEGLTLPPLGILPLGTGNAWARAVGAPWVSTGLRQLATLGRRALPTRPFSMVRVEQWVAPFAGTGWDAEMVTDFKAQLASYPAGPLREVNAGLRGYLTATFTRTVPRHLFGDGAAQVSIYNLDHSALTVDGKGSLRPLTHSGHGALLYQGPASVAGSATLPALGFGLRAFPFAEAVPGRLNVRVYGAGVLEASRNAVRIFRGVHPLPRMHDYFVRRARMEFDRDVPFQIAGDVMGTRRSLEFELAPEKVQVLDWRQLAFVTAARA